MALLLGTIEEITENVHPYSHVRAQVLQMTVGEKCAAKSTSATSARKRFP